MKLIVDMKNKALAYKKFMFHAFYSLGFLLVCRLIANYFIPLNDTTEARYAEIARKMLETGNWVTLQHDYGVPFWAKPPLATWLSAASMKLFGVNEFAARFPSLLLSLAVLTLVWTLAKKQCGHVAGLVAVVVLAGTFYFFLDAGVVMTEPALIFCTTLSLTGFWLALIEGSVLWSYLFFVGLGLGLLAKGPIALVLVGLPLFFWVLWHNKWKLLWQRLPWIKGTLLLCLIALPWYILAERRTPGFLNYFIVGEHIQRFLTPGWTGDKYGMAHHAPKGMIWLYAIAGLLPWIVILGYWLTHYRKKLFIAKSDQGWMSYLILSTLMPLVFFSFAGNIIYPYVFPVLPAFALLFTELWKRLNLPLIKSLWLPYVALTVGCCSIVVTLIFVIKPDLVAKTQKPVIQAWKNQHPSSNSTLIYWGGTPDFSAQFYSRGVVKSVNNMNELCHYLKKNGELYLVVNANDVAAIPLDFFGQLKHLDVINLRKNKVILYQVPDLAQINPDYCK